MYSRHNDGQCGNHARWTLVGIGGRKCSPSFGWFLFHELKLSQNCSEVLKIALDFEQCLSPSSPPLFGWMKLNSDVGIVRKDMMSPWCLNRKDKCAAIILS
uniref:Uncharacterized protein n=1 Tax=Odontella aurita TaxID=265563 RepID=A0A7S4JNU0_9STRA